MSAKPSSNGTRSTKEKALHLLPVMECTTFESFIISYFEGTLTRRQRFVFWLHTHACAECRNYLDAYEKAVDLAQAQRHVPFSEMGMGDVPEGLINAVIAANKK